MSTFKLFNMDSKLLFLPEIPGNLFWQVFISYGEQILNGNWNGSHSVYEIEFSSLPVGIYLIKLTFVFGATVSRRFVKIQE